MRLSHTQREALSQVVQATNDRRARDWVMSGDGNRDRTLRSLKRAGLVERVYRPPFWIPTFEGEREARS